MVRQLKKPRLCLPRQTLTDPDGVHKLSCSSYRAPQQEPLQTLVASIEITVRGVSPSRAWVEQKARSRQAISRIVETQPLGHVRGGYTRALGRH
jgi:hypothetical protein